eukprot:scaffold7682_cov315-Pinguiococcus_pyrenoidosus.AAC.4
MNSWDTKRAEAEKIEHTEAKRKRSGGQDAKGLEQISFGGVDSASFPWPELFGSSFISRQRATSCMDWKWKLRLPRSAVSDMCQVECKGRMPAA